jgi:hypothetical protein
MQEAQEMQKRQDSGARWLVKGVPGVPEATEEASC